MIICKKCGYEGLYQSPICPECNERFTLDEDDIKNQLSILEDAIKNKQYEEVVESYHMLADANYTHAEKEYAKILEKGQLTPRNLDGAMKYYYKAAKKNDPYAAYKYSRLATRENDETGRFWLIYSAILGCSEAYPVVAEEFSDCGYEEDAHYFYWLAAACDDVESIVTMAKRYYEGVGTEQSEEYAKWYMDKLKIPPIYAIKLAYRLRHAEAEEPPAVVLKNYNALLNRLAVQASECGFDTAAFRLREILSERGDADSAAYIGDFLIEGKGCAQDIPRGLHFLEYAASLDNLRAYSILGNLYREGKRVPKNPSLAIKYYQQAGELGSSEAYVILGDILYTGEFGERDIAGAVELYDYAVSMGSADAQRKADIIKKEREMFFSRAKSEEASNPTEAFRLYSISCAMGHPEGTFKTAYCFEFGKGTKKNRHGAYSFYKKAVILEYTPAYYNLGMCYAKGYGTKLDFDKAKEWLLKAERYGDSRAQKAIVSLMERKMKKISKQLYSSAMRLIFQKKFKPAKAHLEIAADLMYPKAIYTLGCLYEFGIVVDCNKEKGYALYEQAYSLFFRDPRARYKLKVLKMLKSVK